MRGIIDGSGSKNDRLESLSHCRTILSERSSAQLIPWLGFVVYPTHRLLKRRNAANFTRRLERNLDAYQAGAISFAELDASIQGWINHVRYADTWGLREHIFAAHPYRSPEAT
jgi:hypothetical protein